MTARDNNGRFVKGHSGYKSWVGKKFSKAHRKRLSEAKKSFFNNGGKHPHEGKKFSDEYRKKLSEAHTGLPSPKKGRPSVEIRGERHWNWKGGITPENLKIRNSIAGKEWSREVFKRDDYTCRDCGARGGYLNAHHIKPFSKYPDKRFDVDNGLTLCVECHKKVTWPKKAMKELV